MEKFDEKKVLFTGGSGLLGSEVKKLLPDADFPDASVFDVTNYNQMDKYLAGKDVKIIVHAAAFTSPPKIDQEPLKGLEINIVGTSNVVKLCVKRNIKLVYICTDYVFKGDKGDYREDDPVYPVNKYAWSKLGGECAVRLYDNSLIIRTTFGPTVFPYEKAFSDQWTSRESVDVVAKKIVDLVRSGANGTVHVGGKRKTVLDYANSLNADRKIQGLSVKDVNFKVPVDTSLNCEKYNSLIK